MGGCRWPGHAIMPRRLLGCNLRPAEEGLVAGGWRAEDRSRSTLTNVSAASGSPRRTTCAASWRQGWRRGPARHRPEWWRGRPGRGQRSAAAEGSAARVHGGQRTQGTMRPLGRVAAGHLARGSGRPLPPSLLLAGLRSSLRSYQHRDGHELADGRQHAGVAAMEAQPQGGARVLEPGVRGAAGGSLGRQQALQ